MSRGCGLWFRCAALVGLLALPGLSRAGGIVAFTRPSGDVTLSFVRAGRIASVSVREGDRVSAGKTLLVEQDNAAEKVQVDQLKARADDKTRIEAAQAQLDQKKVELKRLKEAQMPPLQIDRARLDVTIADLSIKLAKFEQAQSLLKYQEAKLQLGRMRLVSPITGRVEKVGVAPGESVDALKPVIRVVKIDPLWIDVPVPLTQGRGLSVGRTALIAFTGKGARPVVGKVIHVAAVADAASDTLIVRVELPNPKGRPAGEHVRVSFPTAPHRKAGRK